LGRRYGDLLVSFGAPVAELQRAIKEQHIEAEKAEYRPGSGEQENHSARKTDAAERDHQPLEAMPAERAVRCEHRGKNRCIAGGLVVARHGAHYTKRMPRKISSRKPGRRKARQTLGRARAGKAAQLKVPPKRAAADQRAAEGLLPQWTTAEVEEAFRRFSAANPIPKGELQHINPFTLLVAVVLSAQATDAGVNKATPALFAVANTPAKMLALGEARLMEMIRTIGLFRTKAKNLVALSKKLVEEHGGEVPRGREALEGLPGVGRKTANV